MANRNEQKKNWLQRLWGWVQRWTKRHKKNPTAHPTILKRWYGQHCAVLSLERNTKGAIATYRIVGKEGDNWLLCWDDLRERDTDRLGKFDKTTLNLRPSECTGDATHGFSVWRLPLKSGNSKPVLIGAWNIKIELTPYVIRRRKKLGLKPIPVLVAESLALHLRDMELPGGTWQERVTRLDWEQLIIWYVKPHISDFTSQDCRKVEQD